MKKLGMGVTCLASFALAAALWATTPAGSAATALSAQAGQTPAAAQSVSGKIASVEKSSFTLTVASEQKPNVSAVAEQAAPKTMTFQIDSTTTIDGKLKVGASADVTYRQEGGNNIAISVRVS